jgi:hypothetical protein
MREYIRFIEGVLCLLEISYLLYPFLCSFFFGGLFGGLLGGLFGGLLGGLLGELGLRVELLVELGLRVDMFSSFSFEVSWIVFSFDLIILLVLRVE